MLTEQTYRQILYFLVFFKFIFLIFYSLNLYGLLYNRNIYDNTFKIVVILETIFLLSMVILLLYRFSRNTIQVNGEERFLIWTLAFIIISDGFIKIRSVDWK